jgi:hypothetical protein
MKSHVDAPEARARIGIARCDVTPPVGIYHRMWGAATHDRSTGLHRPLTATALYLAPLDDSRPGRVKIALDHCLLWKAEANTLRDDIARVSGLPRDRVTVFFSHTHGAGLMGLERAILPGGDLIPGYLRELGTKLGELVRQAQAAATPATITFGRGKCSLAANRDYHDAEGRAVCGYNPDGRADDTVVVGRITGDEDRPLGVLVNYACHPTTLAWENTLISPDYVGALREVIESATGASCFFVQGASGDVGPVHGYVGDTAVADRNGRQLGYAVLSALEALPPPGTRFRYSGPVVSGATLGRWDYVPRPPERFAVSATWTELPLDVPLPYRPDLRPAETVRQEQARWQAEEQTARTAGDEQRVRDARAMVERATRYLARVDHLPRGDYFPFRTTLTRIGESVWVPLDGEHYNILQRRLRDAFPDVALVIGTIANGSNVWYLPDAESYGQGLYQEEVSVVARGSLERLTDELIRGITQLVS